MGINVFIYVLWCTAGFLTKKKMFKSSLHYIIADILLSMRKKSYYTPVRTLDQTKIPMLPLALIFSSYPKVLIAILGQALLKIRSLSCMIQVVFYGAGVNCPYLQILMKLTKKPQWYLKQYLAVNFSNKYLNKEYLRIFSVSKQMNNHLNWQQTLICW